jgi:hypothetical protein
VPNPVPQALQPKPLALKPLTEVDKRLRTTFRVRLVQCGKGTAIPLNIDLAVYRSANRREMQFSKPTTAVLKELDGRPLAGVVAEVEAPAGTNVEFGAPAATAFAGDREFPAVLLFIAGGKDGIASARLPQQGRLRSGKFGVGSDQYTFEAPPLFGKDKDGWALLPALLEGNRTMEYGFRAGKKVQLGFLFAAKVDDLTHVRVLGHTFRRDATRLDDGGKPEPARPELPAGPEKKAAGLEKKVEQPVARLEVYRYQPQVEVPGKVSRNLQITEDANGNRTVTPVGKNSQVVTYRGPNGQLRGLPDALGSTGLRVVVLKPRPGYTTVAGLRFRQNVTVNIWEDGVVQVSRSGVLATGEDGTRYVSRSVTVNKRRATVMVKVPERPAVKPEEKSPEEKNETQAASKFKLAQSLLKAGKKDTVKRYCEDIIARYPKTKAAAEARKLLDRLTGK